MRALNWHLHAPDSLRPRKLADIMSPSPEEKGSKGPSTAHDLSQPPPLPIPPSQRVRGQVREGGGDAAMEELGAELEGEERSEGAEEGARSLEHLQGVWNAAGDSTGDNSMSS